MTSSGTYNFAPSELDVVREAYDRCGIRGMEVTQEHLVSARRSLNIELQTWANRGLNIWLTSQGTIALVAGTSAYSLPANLVSLLDVYYTLPGTTGQGTTDRLLMPIGRSDYAALPTKQLQGTPTVYWFEQLIAPTITLWQVPSQAATLNYFYLTQLQDASVGADQTPQIPNRFVEALCAGLAARLAEKWKPEVEAPMQAKAKQRWAEAAAQDRETVDIHIMPNIAPYWNI